MQKYHIFALITLFSICNISITSSIYAKEKEDEEVTIQEVAWSTVSFAAAFGAFVGIASAKSNYDFLYPEKPIEANPFARAWHKAYEEAIKALTGIWFFDEFKNCFAKWKKFLLQRTTACIQNIEAPEFL